jgi:type I restriction enzyme S subunit
VTDGTSELESLPTGWTTGVLSDYIDRPEYGFTDTASNDSRGTKFLRITDIQDGQVDWSSVPYCRCPPDVLRAKKLRPGDIVVARIGATTGKSFYIDAVPDEAVFASYLIRLRARPDRLVARYLYFYMQTDEYWSHIELHKGDRLKGGVNISVLESMPVAVPPVHEQIRIVQVLDLLQGAVRSESARAAQAADLGRAALSHIFTRGLLGAPPQETDIGPIPASWNSRAIKDLCAISSGGTPSKSVPAYWTGNIPWVSGKDLKAAALDDAADHVSQEAVEAGSRLAPADAVLLLVRGMGLAKDLPVASITRPMAFNQDVKALVSLGEYSGRFIRAAIYAGRERLLRQIARSAHGTMTLNLNDVEDFRIPCPSQPHEAEQIVEILDAIEAKRGLHLRKSDAHQVLLDTLLHRLLSGTATVAELDVSVLPTPAVEASQIGAGAG